MLYCVKAPINKMYVFGLALLFAVMLAGCGSSGDGTTTEMPPMNGGGDMMPDDGDMTPEEPEGPTPEEIAAMTEAAKTKAEAINQEATESTTAPFDSLTTSENHIVTAEHTDGAVAVNIAVPGAAMDDPEFMRADALPSTEGWDGSMHALGPNDDGETEIVGVYTDIAAPEARAFAMAHTLDANTDGDTSTGTGTAGFDGIDVTNANAAKVGLDAGTSSVKTYGRDDAATMDMNEGLVAGTYDGAAGAFECTGITDCTVTTDAKGAVTAVSQGWTFTPAPGATVDVADADYLYYGFWVKKTDKDGATIYNAVQTFVGSVGIATFTNSGMASVSGTASYAGGAAGVYMKKTFTADGMLDTATSGTFAADVNLMAYFGGDDVPLSKHHSIEGSVSNFALSGGEENSWGVSLKADFGRTDNDFSGTANGGGDEAAWDGTFYGAEEFTPADDDGGALLAPAGVAGEFNAHFSNGHVAGAYGAHRQ